MHRCGIMNIGPKHSDYISTVIKSSRQHKLAIEVLTAEETMQRWPHIKVPDNNVCAFEPNSGYLKCEVIIGHWIRLAREAGCTQLFNCPAYGVTCDGELQKVETASGVHCGRKVLLSAGTWIAKLLLGLPIKPVRHVFGWYEADDRYSESNNFPGFAVFMPNDDIFYGFPAINNVLKVGKHNGGQPINHPDERKPFGEFVEDESALSGFLREVFPGTGKCIYGESCTYDNTVDEDFIIDTHPGEPNQLIISGLSGHGFKFASVLGEIAVAFAQDKPFPFDLSPFSLSRFNKKTTKHNE